MMMKLHIFNPEHDMALAQNSENYTPTKAALQIKSDLSYIPSIWAKEGDFIMVDDVVKAENLCKKLPFKVENINFITRSEIQNCLDSITEISPWGWDKTIVKQLKQIGFRADLLPSTSMLKDIRRLSNRKIAVKSLFYIKKAIENESIIGSSYYLSNLEDLKKIAQQYDKGVIKSPWSSSGRGLRFVDSEISKVHLNWARNVINQQEGIVYEPYYDKIQDFAMEFCAFPDRVVYEGLSVFSSNHGAYLGSIIESETEKLRLLSKYIDSKLLEKVQATLLWHLSNICAHQYIGPLGVDMMIVANKTSPQSYALQPVVEINFRNTMGHVALRLSNKMQPTNKLMQLAFDGSHHSLIISD